MIKKTRYILVVALISLFLLPVLVSAYDSSKAPPFTNKSVDTSGGSWTRCVASESTGIVEVDADRFSGEGEAIIEMRYLVTAPLGSVGDRYTCDFRIKYRVSYSAAGLFLGTYKLKISTQIQSTSYAELDDNVHKNIGPLYSGQDNNDYWGYHDSDLELSRNTQYYLVLKVRIELYGWIWMEASPNSNYDYARFDMIKAEWSFIEV